MRTVDGTKLLVAPDARPPVRGALGAQLLCIYDEYFAGFQERAAINITVYISVKKIQ